MNTPSSESSFPSIEARVSDLERAVIEIRADFKTLKYLSGGAVFCAGLCLPILFGVIALIVDVQSDVHELGREVAAVSFEVEGLAEDLRDLSTRTNEVLEMLDAMRRVDVPPERSGTDGSLPATGEAAPGDDQPIDRAVRDAPHLTIR